MSEDGARRALSIRDLSVRYRLPGWLSSIELTAVREVSFEVAPGRVVALVGESGCGKSSIARAVVGLTPPAAGSIHIGDIRLDRRRRPEQRRAIQMVFQNPRASLNPRRTVRQSLVEALAVAADGRRGAYSEQSLRQLVDSVSLPTRVLDQRPDQLSGGQCQRVAIARALAVGPSFVLADEATAALDATVAAGIVALFRRLATEVGLGVLLITHDLRTVEWIADEVAVMYLGQMVEHGPASTVLSRHRHPYTQCLLLARPSLTAPVGPLPEVRGDVADGGSSGCPFAPRCPRATSICWTERPAARAAVPALPAPGHWVACHHPLA